MNEANFLMYPMNRFNYTQVCHKDIKTFLILGFPAEMNALVAVCRILTFYNALKIYISLKN